MKALPRRPILSLDKAIDDFVIHLEAEHKSPKTIRTYCAALGQLRDHLMAEGRPTDVRHVEPADVKRFLIELVKSRSAATANTRYWALRAFFGWLVDERELEVSPLNRLKPPQYENRATDVLTDAQIDHLFKACAGTSFNDRRDKAMLSVLVDTGCRVGELVGMTTERLHVREGVARIMGKGGYERDLFLGPKTREDLSRYLRARDTHKHSHSTAVWLGLHGPVTASGVGQILKTRAASAGIDPNDVHAHVFRHTFAHSWKLAGGTEDNLMTLGGWRSPVVMQRYGRSAAGARAREAHAKLSPRDRF